uniref:Uncharacterized protein n=1 Tax=Siphoviridae sp. ctJe739 TaxID=2826241 RepID=A0A8S5N7H6_9CAUD|nr:MAG TPA: hypothetical protein [Siphoviridae sp. ctJe739]
MRISAIYLVYPFPLRQSSCISPGCMYSYF